MLEEASSWRSALSVCVQSRFEVKLQEEYGLCLRVVLSETTRLLASTSEKWEIEFSVADAAGLCVLKTIDAVYCDIDAEARRFMESQGLEEEPLFSADMGEYARNLVGEGVAARAATAFWDGFGKEGVDVDWGAVEGRVESTCLELLDEWVGNLGRLAQVRAMLNLIMQERMVFFDFKVVEDWWLWELTVVGSPLWVEVKLGAKGMLYMTAIKEDPVFAEWQLNKQHDFKGEEGAKWLRTWIHEQEQRAVIGQLWC